MRAVNPAMLPCARLQAIWDGVAGGLGALVAWVVPLLVVAQLALLQAEVLERVAVLMRPPVRPPVRVVVLSVVRQAARVATPGLRARVPLVRRVAMAALNKRAGKSVLPMQGRRDKAVVKRSPLRVLRLKARAARANRMSVSSRLLKMVLATQHLTSKPIICRQA